jgi:DNA-3-methyladenine glycosylase II
MWFEPPVSEIPWDTATKYLSKAEPRFAEIIKRVGPCTLAPRRDYFATLCKAIFSQQLSTVVAASLFNRFRNLFPNRRPTPARLLAAIERDPDILRGCGCSRPKAAYLKDLATHFATNKIPTRKFGSMTDEEVIGALVAVKGVGRWTAEMFLMFVLNRPDVWPVDDLGLRVGMQEIFKLKERPTPKQLIEMGEPLKPYRSVATWYVWRRNSA